jgi:hypothetical protein
MQKSLVQKKEQKIKKFKTCVQFLTAENTVNKRVEIEERTK